MIIGFNGKLGSGKDVCYERLSVLCAGRSVERASFADKLKDSACALLGIDRDTMEILKREEEFTSISVREPTGGDWGVGVTSMTMRTFLQRYGTESHRDIFGDDFWLEMGLPSSRDYSDSLVAVTDVRFPNEAAYVRKLGGVVVNVQGPESDTGSHDSEQTLSQDLVDYWIDNTIRDDDFANLDRQLAVVMAIVQSGVNINDHALGK